MLWTLRSSLQSKRKNVQTNSVLFLISFLIKLEPDIINWSTHLINSILIASDITLMLIKGEKSYK